VLSFARRRYLFTSIAIAGMAATWAVMLAFDWSSKLGTVALTPWVALLGFDLGIVGGVVGAAAAVVLWIIATEVGDVAQDTFQIVVRSVVLVVLGVISALAGQRLRSQERQLRETAQLQSALIDATLDGIVLTDAAHDEDDRADHDLEGVLRDVADLGRDDP